MTTQTQPAPYITVWTFPDKEPRDIPLGEIEGVLETSSPLQAGVKLRSGELVVVLHSPKEVHDELARVWPADPLSPLPKLEPERVLRLVRERVMKRGGHRYASVPPQPNIANSYEVEALAYVLCEEFNRVLEEALE